MRVVFLVPRRKDDGPRDRIWAYCRARWEALFPDVDVVEGHHDEGAFNRSAAINRAAELADEGGAWDIGIVIDADVVLSESQVRAAIETVADTGRVTWAHRRWRGVREDATKRILDDRRDLGAELDRDELDLVVERTNPLSWSCCIAMPRAVFDDLGGFDERFEGWGFEDMAFQSVICGLYGYERIGGDVVHLFHPRSEERITPGETRLTATREYVTNARLGRRYMVALRRDHALHDRGDQPASEAERLRDIENLRRDDEKYSTVVQRLKLPDWTTWWPTLEELRDGAKAYREGRGLITGVTVVVRTGGAPETWEARSEYLRRSLASLDEHLKGPIVQRVIYSDWGDHQDELAAIGEPHGFYVAGSGHHGYTGAVARLWRYLENRALGDYVFVAEDDFVYLRDVDLVPMAETLRDHSEIRQVALLRGACYPRELEADGILGWPAESFEAKDQGNGHGRLEHRNFWTMNPALYRRSITEHAWPVAASSERVFGDQLLRDKSARFALWGAGEPWLEHIGEIRSQPTGATY
jgi:hypothetical protein